MDRAMLRAGLITGSLVLVVQSGFSEEAVEQPPGARKAQPCLSCHGMDHFAQFSREELDASVQSIAAGESAHIPLPLSLSEQDLAEIVAYLSAASRSAD